MEKNNRNIIFLSTIVVIVMFGFCFALSPLYNKYCRITGINTAIPEKEFATQIDLSRNIHVQFVATLNENLPWDFYPQKNKVIVHPNQTYKVFFYVKNKTKKTMTVQAIPSFSPGLASQHFHKIECFCFKQQTLAAGNAMWMPLVFRVDKTLPTDINTITLAYTLFDVTT